MFHPMDPDAANEPFAQLSELRRECPVPVLTRVGMEPIAYITRYEDAVTVYRACEAVGHITAGGPRTGSGAGDPSAAPDLNIIANSVLGQTGAKHAAARRVAMGAVVPRAVTEAEPAIKQICEAVVASVPYPGPVDLAASWASTVPSRAIGHLLGFPAEDYKTFYEWTKAFNAYSRPESDPAAVAALNSDRRTASESFVEYVSAHVERRRSGDAPDDAITRMIAACPESGGPSEIELISNVIFTLMAGNQTTQSLLNNTVYHLVTTNTYEKVRADRQLVPRAIEESLRVAPPINHVVREPTTDLRVGDVIIPAGHQIVIGNLSSNHDECVWGGNAETFDLERVHPVKHLAFASGAHACIGAALARTVGALAVEALMDRFEAIELVDGYHWKKRAQWTSWGPATLEVSCRQDPSYVQQFTVEGQP